MVPRLLLLGLLVVAPGVACSAPDRSDAGSLPETNLLDDARSQPKVLGEVPRHTSVAPDIWQQAWVAREHRIVRGDLEYWTQFFGYAPGQIRTIIWARVKCSDEKESVEFVVPLESPIAWTILLWGRANNTRRVALVFRPTKEEVLTEDQLVALIPADWLGGPK